METYREFVTATDFAGARGLLEEAGLGLPENIDYGLGLYEDEQLLGTAFLSGAVVCGVCVSPKAHGSGIASALVSRIVMHALGQGLSRLALFTRPDAAPKFADLGFSLVVRSSGAALLELGKPDYQAWREAQRERLALFPAPAAELVPETETKGGGTCFPDSAGHADLGAIVVNANPFTLGHRHLAEAGAACCRRLVIFVVEEEASVFPFAVRLELVRRGVADLPGVLVLPSGPYMVSRSTFPAYFTCEQTFGRVHAELDATLFASRIAPDLGISLRLVGSEPYCAVTAKYNQVLHEVFTRNGLALREVPRLEVGGAPVSASRVRRLLHDDPPRPKDWEELRTLTPQTTLAFLRSAQAEPVLANLRGSTGRH